MNWQLGIKPYLISTLLALSVAFNAPADSPKSADTKADNAKVETATDERAVGMPVARFSGAHHGTNAVTNVVPAKLTTGKKYIIDWSAPLVIDGFSPNGGSIDVKEVTGPHSYSSTRVITNYPADPDDVCVVAGPFIYEVTLKTPGLFYLEVHPALKVDKEGKPVPLTVKDNSRRVLDLDDGSTPKPIPVTPQSDEAALTAMKTAYDKEPASTRANYVNDLASFYRGAASQYVTDEKVKTWGDFSFAMQKGREKVIDGKIPLIRKAMADNIFNKWPTAEDKEFDEKSRQMAADTLNRAATLLEELK
jgi:hypothetical protein